MNNPAYYDSYDYPAYWTGREYEHKSEVIAIRAFLQKIAHITNIADIGCGFGRLTPYYLYRTKKVSLIDPSRKLLKEAQKRIENHKIAWHIKRKKITYIQSKVENVSKKVKRGEFDLVIMVRVMHHVLDPKETIEAISSLLSPGGYLILEFANKIHGKALISNFLKGNFTFPLDIFPADRLTKKSKASIPFFNYHPDVMKDILNKNGFTILESRSVSNIRNAFLKKSIPLSTLLSLEESLQRPLNKLHFGPSIFLLAKKKG